MDGFCAGTNDKNKIMEIMKDSRIGTMGVMSIAALLLLKYELLNNTHILSRTASLILMCTAGRWSQVLVSRFSRYAGAENGTGKPFVGMVSKKEFYIATGIFATVCLFTAFLKGIVIALFVSATAFCLMKFVNRKIDGMTGDTIGAVSEVMEVVVLLLAVLIL